MPDTRAQPPFDAILFDAGGVLVVPTPSEMAPLLEPFGAATDVETLVRAHFVAAHAMDHARSEGSNADWVAYRHGYAQAAGVAAEALDAATSALAAEFDDRMWTYPIPGARDTLAELAERGVPIGIVSNAAGQVEGELAQLGMAARISARAVEDAAERNGALRPVPVVCIVDSHIVGVAKPDPRIFDSALDALGMPASARVAYVGDTVFYDVRAARAAGLTPLLHDPFGCHADDPHPLGPAGTLRRLAELLELV